MFIASSDTIPLQYVYRQLTSPDVSPYDDVEWNLRTAEIKNSKGKTIFIRKNVEAPVSWSDHAVQIAASKYFRGCTEDDTDVDGERSVRVMIERVVSWYVKHGVKQGYFSEEQAQIFGDELRYIFLHQMAAPNSPVWFNVNYEPEQGEPCPNPECQETPYSFCVTCRGTGIAVGPQVAACFLNPVEDNMGSILQLVTTEGRLFAQGSGTGTNLSTLRGSSERLSGGGKSSGPVSFLRVYDAAAGVIKSGGKTRRAAKLNILNVDHPDIEDFVVCKMEEEKKARVLVEAGYDDGMDGPAYTTVRFQNENLSVWAQDEFMRAVEDDDDWELKAVKDGRAVKKLKARKLMKLIAKAAWECADPGIGFTSTINAWHTTPSCCGPITTGNPCHEFLQADGTACNLASLNLMRFYDPVSGSFDVGLYRHTVRLVFTAMDISITASGYPTQLATKMANKHRPLGIGVMNLGALLMAMGLPYDSEEGRQVAAWLYSLMTAEAYATSARIAQRLQPYDCFEKNREEHLRVMEKHLAATKKNLAGVRKMQAAQLWEEAIRLGKEHGYRNSQASLAAPTGTISFITDCSTTGIEPDFALVKLKRLAGQDGHLWIENGTIPVALKRLGYTQEQIELIVEYLRGRKTIEGAPFLKKEHMPVFDCAVEGSCHKCAGAGCSSCGHTGRGKRAIHYMGHIKMLAALMPFLSGSASKTVNIPASTSVEEIQDIYVTAWKMGIKNIALYRDGCKGGQPLSVGKNAQKNLPPKSPPRVRLPDENDKGKRRKFRIGYPGTEVKGFIHTGEYDDGTLGELFLDIAKSGSALSSFGNALSIAVSIGLQHGIPLTAYVEQFSHMDFEPKGPTSDKAVPDCRSILDYVFRWLALKYLGQDKEAMIEEILANGNHNSNGNGAAKNGNGHSVTPADLKAQGWSADAGSLCKKCGSVMHRAGSCYACFQCAETSGCAG